MPRKRHDGLFSRIASFRALRLAARRAIRGKRGKPMPAAFMAGLERELLKLERELLSGTYKPGGYVEIRIEDPKPRLVSAAPFRDRVVHHALCTVIEPAWPARPQLPEPERSRTFRECCKGVQGRS
jgi:hypothetical protein